MRSIAMLAALVSATALRADQARTDTRRSNTHDLKILQIAVTVDNPRSETGISWGR